MDFVDFLVILAIVGIVLLLRKRKQNNSSGSTVASKEERKAINEFQEALSHAKGGSSYGATKMGEVAKCYAAGIGVQQDLQEALRWKEKELEAKLFWKAGLSHITGVLGYDVERMVDFFLTDQHYPKNAALAKQYALRLMDHEEPRSALLLDRIDALTEMGYFSVAGGFAASEQFLQEKSSGGNGWATYQLARNIKYDGKYEDGGYDLEVFRSYIQKARRQGNLAAQCTLLESDFPNGNIYSWRQAMDQLDARYRSLRVSYLLEEVVQIEKDNFFKKQWKEEAAQAGVSSISDTICWVMEKTGNPRPSGYRIPKGEGTVQYTYEVALEYLEKGWLEMALDRFQECANKDHKESARMAGLMRLHIYSTYEGDDEYERGMELLKIAARSGNPFAMQDLGRPADIATLAGIACEGDPEAIMRLAMEMKKQSGLLSQQGAQYLFDLAWDTIGNEPDELTGPQLLLKHRIMKERGYSEALNQDKYLFYLAKAMKKGYKPAEYLLMFAYGYGRASGHDTQRNHAKVAAELGFGKAKLLKSQLDQLDKNWKDYVDYEKDRSAVGASADAYNRAITGKGIPNVDELKYRAAAAQAVTLAEAEELESASSGSADTKVRDVPNWIYDEYGRRWCFKVLWSEDHAEYELDRDSFDALEDAFGSTVTISTRNISGRTAKTFGHTFHW